MHIKKFVSVAISSFYCATPILRTLDNVELIFSYYYTQCIFLKINPSRLKMEWEILMMSNSNVNNRQMDVTQIRLSEIVSNPVLVYVYITKGKKRTEFMCETGSNKYVDQMIYNLYNITALFRKTAFDIQNYILN